MDMSNRIRMDLDISPEDRLPPTHPGEVLREEFMGPYGLTAYRLAQDLGIPAPRVYDIVKEKRGITTDTAVRLALYFGGQAEFWLNLQRNYELKLLLRLQGAEIMSQVKPCTATPVADED